MAIEFFINSETLHFDDSTPIYIFVAFLNLKSHTHTKSSEKSPNCEIGKNENITII